MAGGNIINQLSLSENFSRWSRREMGFEITSSELLGLLKLAEGKNMWTYVIKNVKSETPLKALPGRISEIVKPVSLEVICDYEHLRSEESSLDLEIAELERNIQVYTGTMTSHTETINNLKTEVHTHESNMQILKAYKFLLDKDIRSITQLLDTVDRMLSSLPQPHNYNKTRIESDLEEVLQLLHNYYQTPGNAKASGRRKEFQNKVRQMTKQYRTDNYFEFLSAQANNHQVPQCGDADGKQIMTGVMEKCLSQLYAAHKEDFISSLAISNSLHDLNSQKSQLLNQFKEKIKSLSSSSQLEELCTLKLSVIHKQEMIRCLSEPKVPLGIAILSCGDLSELLEQTDSMEEAIRNLELQFTKVLHSNKVNLENLSSDANRDSSKDFDVIFAESKELKSDINFSEIYKKLGLVEDLLSQLRTQGPDASDLSVRPDSKLMSGPLKERLQSALSIPVEEAPEMLGFRLQRKTEDLHESCISKKLQDHLLKKLDLDRLTLKFLSIFQSVEDATSKADSLAKKANKVADYVSSVLECKELKESWTDYQKQPAFDEFDSV